MICRRCGKKIEKGWRYCSNCGSVTQRQSRSLFDELFAGINEMRGMFSKNRESMFKSMDRLADKEFEVLDLSPLFGHAPMRGARKPNAKGFTIKM